MYEYDGVRYQNESGALCGNNIHFHSVNGTVDLTNFTVNNLEAGLIDSMSYLPPFLNITGRDMNLDTVTISDASLAGRNAGTAVWILANGTLTVNNFVFSNITPAEYNSTYFNEDIQDYVYDYHSTAAGAGISMYVFGDATLTNVNITNVCGGANDGVLLLDADNATLRNILIDNITVHEGITIIFDSDSRDYIMQTNVERSFTNNAPVFGPDSYWLSPGINVNTIGNAVLDNINISNIELRSYLEDAEQQHIINVESIGNLTASNININNFTHKPFVYCYFDANLSAVKYNAMDGFISPVISFSSSNNTVLSNISMDSIIITEISAGGVNVSVDNFRVTNSIIGGNTEEGIIFDLLANDTLNVNNMMIDNIYDALPINHTYSIDYFDKNGDYVFTQTVYEITYLEEGAAFGIKCRGNDAALSNVSITNIFASTYGGISVVAR